MSRVKPHRVVLILLFFLISVQGCIFKEKRNAKEKKPAHRELVVYCENGILAPVLEITKQFQADHDIEIRIQNDCSQNLISLLQFTRDADVFIPDTKHALEKLRRVQPDIFSDSIFLGFNPMVFLVAKGNPLKFNGNLNKLNDRRLSIILANPETSSLGYETQKLLSKNSLFDKIMRDNIVALSVDSRGLLKNVALGQAALSIDWLSSFKQNSNHLLVDTISLSVSNSLPEIYAASLTASENPLMAQAFLETLNSNFGAEIFRKYGIRKRPSFVF